MSTFKAIHSAFIGGFVLYLASDFFLRETTLGYFVGLIGLTTVMLIGSLCWFILFGRFADWLGLARNNAKLARLIRDAERINTYLRQ